MGPVGRPDLLQRGLRGSQNIWNPEAVTDLDQFPSRHDDLPVMGEFVEDQKDRSCIVVDDDGRSTEQCLSNSRLCVSRLPRLPCSMSYSRLQYRPAVSAIARRASTLSGARPRFVCRITPDALITPRGVLRSNRFTVPADVRFDGVQRVHRAPAATLEEIGPQSADRGANKTRDCLAGKQFQPSARRFSLQNVFDAWKRT